MPKGVIIHIDPPGTPEYVEFVAMSPGSPPDRPQPLPPLDIWGPSDPRPTHPIQLPPWAGKPQPPFGGGGNGGGGDGGGSVAIVAPLPPPAEGEPAPTPPEGSPQGSTQMLVWFGPGTIPVKAWIPPYVSAAPPAEQPGTSLPPQPAR